MSDSKDDMNAGQFFPVLPARIPSKAAAQSQGIDTEFALDDGEQDRLPGGAGEKSLLPPAPVAIDKELFGAEENPWPTAEEIAERRALAMQDFSYEKRTGRLARRRTYDTGRFLPAPTDEVPLLTAQEGKQQMNDFIDNLTEARKSAGMMAQRYVVLALGGGILLGAVASALHLLGLF